ncbi:MAG: hypothetical protein FWE14_03205 [Lachnospiraceae bacterium]|nr:hypothetical protein [Lachnospiraceae bacterium]
MKAKKLVALLLAGVLTLSLTACGSEEQETIAPAPVVEESAPIPAPEVVPEEPREVSIDFADGNYGFIAMYTGPVNADNSELSVVDWNGSKALQVKNVDGQKSYIAIDIGSVLGNDIANLAGIDMTIGTSHDGGFSAISGKYQAWVGNQLYSNTEAFSVYLANRNPNRGVVSNEITDLFTAGTENLLIMYLDTDTGPEQGNGFVTFYIGDIRFLDSAGNTLKGDSTVAFNGPDAFYDEGGLDRNMYYLANAVEVDGFAGTGGGGWSQVYVALSDDEKAMLVPGSMIEINYNSAGPAWVGYNGDDWIRVNWDHESILTGDGIVQFSFEQMEAAFGEGFAGNDFELFVEASEDFEVLNLRIGTAVPIYALGKQHDIAGFAGTGGGGWSQVYVPLTDEEKAMLVPGSVIEIAYASAGPAWVGYNGDDWIRVNWDHESILTGDGIVQFSFEEMEAAFGEGFAGNDFELFVESSEDFEIFHVKIGLPILKSKVVETEITGFAGTGGGGWSQVYVPLTDDEKALLVPGAIITFAFDSIGTAWIGYNGADWIRVNWDADAVNSGGGLAQSTFEEMEAAFGEGFADTDFELFVEASEDFEVFYLKIGNRN